MGWKTLKEAYGIKHIVCVTDEGICIGTSYAHDLVVVDPSTGVVQAKKPFERFLSEHYPLLAAASQAEVLRYIQIEDTFSSAIKVFTFDGADIIERRCEALGWPNVTHDGYLMYENKYSAERDVVIGWAKRNAELKAQLLEEALNRLQEEQAALQLRLVKARADTERLAADHPLVPSASSD